MNSQKRMMPTDINLLPPGEICRIIESCGKAGVRVLKYGNLYLNLGPAPAKIVSDYPILPLTAPLPKPVDHARQNADTLAHDEEEIRAEQLRMLMIEDPMEYERQLKDGELDDEPGESNESE
jgi:hypothetical protein